MENTSKTPYEIELEELQKYFSSLNIQPDFRENVQAEWEKWGQTLVYPDGYDNIEPIVISTIINEDTREIQNNIFNLQYFFIYADRFQKLQPGHDIVLIVKCLNGGDEFRVRIYLYIQARFRNHIKIAVKHINTVSKREKEWKCSEEYKFYSFPQLQTNEMKNRVGKLLPLIRVSAEYDNGSVSYLELAESGTKWLDKEKLMNNDFLLLEGTKQDLFPWGKTPCEVLNYVMMTNIAVLKEKAAQNKKLEDSEQKKLILFLEDISNRLEGMSYLAQMIWLYELRYIFEETDLTSVASNYWGDIEMVWEYTRWNAVAYAEGILQLLENSCQHSCGKSGYFSFRVHDVNVSTSNARVLEVAERRERIYRRFRINTSDQPLDITEKSYLEFSVIDDAYDIEQHRLWGVAEKAGVENMCELFWEPEKRTDKKLGEEIKEDIIHHYGLPLFCSNIILNRGRFLFESAGDSKEKCCFAAFVGKGKKEKEEFKKSSDIDVSPEQISCTHYRILVPMLTSKVDKLESISNVQYNSKRREPESLFDDTLLKQKPTKATVVNIDGRNFFPDDITALESILQKCATSQKEKILYVNNIEGQLQEKLAELADFVLVKVDIRNYRRSQIELFAKGLFSFFSSNLSAKHILLYFGEDSCIAEFIRICSIFYNCFGEREWVAERQIALCAYDDASGCPVVKTVLAGRNLEMVNETARTYMYYNIEFSQSLLAQLRYLTRKVEKKSVRGVAPIYPFDLVKYDGKNESWFQRRMSFILEKDLRSENMGCKIKNAHVRLGSRIHIRDFYEAELLFHNIGNVYRFAYCIAEKIVCSVDNKDFEKPLILVGYENYSILLVSEIVRILKDYDVNHLRTVMYMTFIRSRKGRESVVFSAELAHWQKEMEDQGKNAEILKANYISILPIGSTMSTVYKLINVTTRELYEKYNKYQSANEAENKLSFLQHYAVIVVACKNNHEVKLQDQYWIEHSEKNTLTLKAEKNRRDYIEQEVEYFLKVKTDWYLPGECPMCGLPFNVSTMEKHYPLGYVDKTSTVPKLIYPSYKSNFTGISFSENNSKTSESKDTEDENNNLQKLLQLQGCISYGHIIFLNNHFQFFVDFPKYFENCIRNSRELLEQWFEEQRNGIERYAFNIVVSPLSELEPNFLKAIIDRIFQDNIRFLYIPLNKSFKENIRARFRYFAEEYKNVRKSNPQMPVNVYYVDYSVVSAQTLYRGRNLINMLMEESGMDVKKNVNVYKKVFVLLNRSSYDTVNSFVEDPHKDFCAYATLAIPSFNTWESSCPICEKVDLYSNLAKCSASNELYWYYKRLENKLSVRTPDEYMKWQKDRILADAGYLRKLLQRYLDVELIQRSVQKNGRKKRKKASRNIEVLAQWLQKYYMVSLDKRTEDFAHDIYTPILLVKDTIGEKYLGETERENIAVFVQEKIIDVKNCLRLICMHKVIKLQESFYQPGFTAAMAVSGERYQDKVEQRLISFLQSEICPESEESINIPIIIKREILISYIKVMSRGYLAYLEPVRTAVYRLIEELMDCLLEQWTAFSVCDSGAKVSGVISKEFVELLKVPSEIDDYWQIYQLAVTMLKRLCDLQSVKMLDYNFFKQWLAFTDRLWEEYQKKYYSESEKTELQKNNKKGEFAKYVLEDYVQCLKWSLAADEDSGKGSLIKDLCNKIRAEEDEREWGQL